ncbi:BEL1-like homeodomain protein 1 [Cucurbita maxima]|uniref:BEL1-like homeodomain protein 1 n=1 Tax=Cucurbita maxima TaxID=3661 RepID=A0A6J1J5R0_CUCMA|nr:BEL1-like homeodomain protein 1 [Cucurbita maxima]XP_022982870.1 BEL1-like homeodomain protein 1 [Cucurbita maxima]
MATYLHANSDHFQSPDAALQTLVLRNPTYVQFSDTPPPPPPPSHPNLLFFNSPAPAPAPAAPNSFSTQQFVGIPTSQDNNSHSLNPHHDISAFHGFLPRVQPNIWNSIDPSTAARDSSRAQQGLSLSLSSQHPPGFGSRDVQSHTQQAVSGEETLRISGGSSSSASGVSNGVAGIQGVLISSKYLKAAQELLDEVVNVTQNEIKNESSPRKGNGNQTKMNGDASAATGTADVSLEGEADGKRAVELTTAERQEIQMKKVKLISMLDEVEQRYRQYHHQMQIVISTFDQAAGAGSARTYTALALQTISKQFRWLKDAIAGQIRAASKSLGEEECVGKKTEGSRLKFVDHHLRQQRALQQLGMIQHNAWRPQRGLPERSVSILRAWLFEHFLHPYPKDSDKHMLAKQTGLTRSQVSNWFINARVRLWKPMVEEMYMEEIKDQEQKGGGSTPATVGERNNEDSVSKSMETESPNSKQENSPNQNVHPSVSISNSSGGNVRNPSGFTLIGTSSELDGITQRSAKKQRGPEILHSSDNSVAFINMDIKPREEGGQNQQNQNQNHDVPMKFDEERQNRDGYSFLGQPHFNLGGFGQYPIGEMARFEADEFTPRFSGNNGVSLTLGLPHCENLSLNAATHQRFLPNQGIQLGRRTELGKAADYSAMNASTTAHSSTAFETMNIQNGKRFAAQLLPDFVA